MNIILSILWLIGIVAVPWIVAMLVLLIWRGVGDEQGMKAILLMAVTLILYLVISAILFFT